MILKKLIKNNEMKQLYLFPHGAITTASATPPIVQKRMKPVQFLVLKLFTAVRK